MEDNPVFCSSCWHFRTLKDKEVCGAVLEWRYNWRGPYRHFKAAPECKNRKNDCRDWRARL